MFGKTSPPSHLNNNFWWVIITDHNTNFSSAFDWQLHHVGLSVHVEDEDDEKNVFQLKLNHAECCWTAGSNVLFCLVLMCIGIWGTPLPWELVEGWQEHLLMVYNLVVDTVVLLVFWNQRVSCRVCFRIVVSVGKVLNDWCQSWRCSLGTWPTIQSIRAPIEKFGIFRRSAIGPVQRCIRGVSLLLFLHQFTGCVRSFSLLTGLLWYGGKEFSTLQKLLGFGPSYFDGVEDRRHTDTCSIPLVHASGKTDTE